MPRCVERSDRRSPPCAANGSKGPVRRQLGEKAAITEKIKKERKKRLGIGEKEAGQVLAIYRTLYEKLVKKGMPESCTMTDGSVTDYLQAHYTGMTGADLQRLQTLILTASYGFQEISGEDVLWLRRFGGKLKKKKDR